MASSATQSVLDTLLEQKSDAFKGRVLELVRRYKVSEDDPTFILLLGTNTLEALLEKHPKEFESLFAQLLKGMEERWRQLQAEWAVAADKSTSAANNLAQAVSLVKQAADVQQGVIKSQGEQQAKLLSQVFEEQRVNLAKETERLIAQGAAIAQKEAASQFEENAKQLRWRHYAEAGLIACASAAVMLFSGWAYGWHSRGTQEANSDWADIERWNQDELQACQQAKMPTCNFHIKVPEAKND